MFLHSTKGTVTPNLNFIFSVFRSLVTVYRDLLKVLLLVVTESKRKGKVHILP